LQIGDITLRAAYGSAESSKASKSTPAKVRKLSELNPAGRWSVLLMPVTLPLGGKDPATLEGRFDSSGYTLQLAGSVIAENLLALGAAIPALGDGLSERLDDTVATLRTNASSNPLSRPAALPTAPMPVDLTATRPWGGPQIWSDLATHSPAHKRAYSPNR
jgi:AsmA protein